MRCITHRRLCRYHRSQAELQPADMAAWVIILTCTAAGLGALLVELVLS